MRYLMRDGAPLEAAQWDRMDKAVIEEAKKVLVGRRFLTLAGPLGGAAQTVPLDSLSRPEAKADFWGNADIDAVEVERRRCLNLLTVYADFLISWRDVELPDGVGVQAAREAAMAAARREDDLIFYGSKDDGVDGLVTAAGVVTVPISDWGQGENPVQDVTKAIEALVKKGNAGERALVVSTDLYAKLHRIQPGTGVMEVERVKSMVNGRFFHTTRLQKNQAVLVYCDAYNVDLAVGQDLVIAYLGNRELNHSFRVMETIAPRVKRPSAIAVIR